MLWQILVALGLTVVTVLIHGVGTLLAIRRLTRAVSAHQARHGLGLITPLAVLVGSLLLLSVIEANVWAALFLYAGYFQDFETAAYFSFTSYTTVGYGDVVLPLGRRLLGPIEAAVGVLMFGWSTGVLVAAVQRIMSAMSTAPDHAA